MRTSGALHHPIRILIVCDSPGMAPEFSRKLNSHTDIDVVGEINNKGDVFLFLASQPLDILLMEINDDARICLEIVRKTREEFPLVRVIFLSSNGDFVQDALEIGVHGYLRKDMGNNLPNAIRAVMAGERLLAPSLVPVLHGLLQQRA